MFWMLMNFTYSVHIKFSVDYNKFTITKFVQVTERWNCTENLIILIIYHFTISYFLLKSIFAYHDWTVVELTLINYFFTGTNKASCTVSNLIELFINLPNSRDSWKINQQFEYRFSSNKWSLLYCRSVRKQSI